MKLKVTLSNSAGWLDSRVTGEEEPETHAAQLACQMISEAGELHAGDTITVEEVSE